MNTINHIGIIMDGNRRWAKARGLSAPHQGHDRGADVFVDACGWCIDHQVKYLTAYAFSTENWKRSQTEVSHIFKLLERFAKSKIDTCLKESIRIRIIGERARFDQKTLSVIEDMEARTAHCTNLYAQLAVSYGGRDEIVRASLKMADDIAQGKLNPADADEDIFAAYLDTAGMPDVDLVIRTGGAENRRLSGFLPWQTTYSELYFSDLLWPDFTEREFKNALDYYTMVKRRHGK